MKHYLLLSILISTLAIGQVSDSTSTKRVGVIGIFDYAYNTQDKVLNPSLGRKISVGISFTNKKREFIGFVALGLKGFKFNLNSPTFQQTFINDIKNNYIPIEGYSLDSVIGAKMNNSPGNSLWGTYSHYLHFGFFLNRKLRPSFSFYMGKEELLLHDRAIAQFEDPDYGDIDYVGMFTSFYEFKFGVALPFKKFIGKSYYPSLNFGYKWVDYGSLIFKSTPLSAYTANSIENNYRAFGKFTISLSFSIWSNWQ